MYFFSNFDRFQVCLYDDPGVAFPRDCGPNAAGAVVLIRNDIFLLKSKVFRSKVAENYEELLGFGKSFKTAVLLKINDEFSQNFEQPPQLHQDHNLSEMQLQDHRSCKPEIVQNYEKKYIGPRINPDSHEKK